MKKEPALTYNEALNTYFGGIHGIAKMCLPFTCRCGGKAFSLSEVWKHIRIKHKERIKNA